MPLVHFAPTRVGTLSLVAKVYWGGLVKNNVARIMVVRLYSVDMRRGVCEVYTSCTLSSNKGWYTDAVYTFYTGK